MAYKISYRTRVAAGSTYFASLKKTLVNSGNRFTPTPYHSFAYVSGENVGTTTSENFIYRTSSTYDTTLFSGSTPLPGNSYWADQYTDSATAYAGWSDAYNKAVSKLIEKALDSRVSDFNAAVFTAEASKSLDMIANSAYRIASAGRFLRKGDLVGMYRALGQGANHKYRKKRPRATQVRDNLSGYWLEASYGWLPLISDAHAGALKLASYVQSKPQMLKLKARGSARKTTLDSQTSTYPKTYSMTTETVKVEVGFNYTVSNHALQAAASLGLTNPLLVAWELVPFSFVIDWFLPIGDFLESLSAYHGLTFGHGYISTLSKRDHSTTSGDVRVTETREFFRGEYQVATRVTEYAGGFRTTSHAFNRSLLTDFPRPRFPAPKGGITSVRRALSAISLLHVTTRK